MSLAVICIFVSVTDYYGDWILKHCGLDQWLYYGRELF